MLNFEPECSSQLKRSLNRLKFGPSRSPLPKVLFGISAVALLALGSTFAANINLNNNQSVEFGQGIVQAVACDDAVTLTPYSAFVNASGGGSFIFTSISVTGISSNCDGKSLTIKAYKSGVDTPLALYTSASDTYTALVVADSAGDFALAPGVNGLESTTIQATSPNGFTVTFTSNGETPTAAAAIANDVDRITIESGNFNDGSSPLRAVASGYQLAQDFPTKPSGWYWIKSSAMPNPLRMYVDMTEESGGYDFYFITDGPAVDNVTDPNGGTPLGLDLVMPRSKYHWRAMQNAVKNAAPSGDFYQYFSTSYGVYRNTLDYGDGFTDKVMNSSGSAAPAWRVKDGGRWWLRDTVFGEPNGDYNLYGLLSGGMYQSWNLEDLEYNDGWESYSTYQYYLVSTNAKP